MKRRHIYGLIAALALLLLLFLVDLTVGSVKIPIADVWHALIGDKTVNHLTSRIVIDVRLLKAIVATVSGMALSVAGLQMQTLFRNPLAGPYVLGVSAGASLGVAVLILGATVCPALQILASTLGIAGAAWVGSAAVLFFIAVVAHRVRDIMVILIIGMMFSSAVGAIVQIMQYLSNEESLKSFVIWTMGSLGEVTGSQLAILTAATAIGLILAFTTVKPLNLLLLGEDYAITMGLNIARARLKILLSTTLLAGTVTAFCGPIGFIGLAMPHVARTITADSNHNVLLPATLLTGGIVMLLCDIVSKMFVLPINAITALVGIPVVIAVVLKNK